MAKITIHHPDGSQVKYGLNGDVFTIGRAANNDIVLPGGSSSNFHAVLKKTEGGDFTVTDLESTNHTKVNNKSISTTLLQNTDVVLFGDTMAVYESDVPPVAEDDQPTQVYEKQMPPPSYPAGASSTAAAAPAAAATAPASAPAARGPQVQRPGNAIPRRISASGNDGCFAGFMAILVAIIAFVAGCWIRHAQDHKGEALTEYFSNLGQPKVVTVSEKDGKK